jgi:hypothetical protein
MILSFHCARDLMQGLGGGRGEPRDANPPEDAARQEAKRASHGETWAQREREREREPSVPPDGWRKGAGWTPPLDLGPPTRGKKKGDDSASLVFQMQIPISNVEISCLCNEQIRNMMF